jgi:hypothetical protein
LQGDLGEWGDEAMSAKYLKDADGSATPDTKVYDGRYHFTIANEDQLSNFQKAKAPPATLSNPINTHTFNVFEQIISEKRRENTPNDHPTEITDPSRPPTLPP